MQGKRDRDPLVPGAGGVPRHPGPDRPGGSSGLRDAIAEQGAILPRVNPVVPVQLIVDHSLAVEWRVRPRGVRRRTAPSRTAATRTASTSSTGRKAFKNNEG